VWIQSLHNLHCPTCGRRLVQRARRCQVPGAAAPRYVGEVGTLTCQEGHPLPGRGALYAYRAQRRHPARATVREVAGPLRDGARSVIGSSWGSGEERAVPG
jgi:hypothetical protein